MEDKKCDKLVLVQRCYLYRGNVRPVLGPDQVVLVKRQKIDADLVPVCSRDIVVTGSEI